MELKIEIFYGFISQHSPALHEPNGCFISRSPSKYWPATVMMNKGIRYISVRLNDGKHSISIDNNSDPHRSKTKKTETCSSAYLLYCILKCEDMLTEVWATTKTGPCRMYKSDLRESWDLATCTSFISLDYYLV